MFAPGVGSAMGATTTSVSVHLSQFGIAYLWVEGDITLRYQDRDKDGRDRQQGYLSPKQSALRKIEGLQREGRQRPEVTVCIHRPKGD